MKYHVYALIAFFLIAIHPILALALGWSIAGVFGLKKDGPGFEDQFVAGINIGNVCEFLTLGYPWFFLFTMPLLLIVIPYAVVILYWGICNNSDKTMESKML